MEYTPEDENLQNIIIVVAGAIIILPIVLYFCFGGLGVEIFSIIVTSLLTLSLVVLYFQQSRILDKQTELMHRDYQSALVKRGDVIADDDTVRFKMRNAGRGKVRKMFLKCEVVSDTGNVDVEYGRVPIQSVEDGSHEIAPESEWKDYEAEVRFRIPSIQTTEDERAFPFKMLTKQLSHEGIDSLTLKLTIEVIDEGIVEGNFSYINSIAEQEIEVSGPVTEEIDGEERTRHLSTSLEESLGSNYSSSRDINPISLERLAEENTIIETESN